jgi:hypothetical protein
MSSRALSFLTRGAALAATMGLVAAVATAKPAHADTWIQFGVALPSAPLGVAPSLPPPAPVYSYAYTYPYAYAYPYGYYVAPRRVYERRVDVYGRHEWREHHWRDRDDRHDDDD